MRELLTVEYSSDLAAVGRKIDCSNRERFLYGEWWQEGSFWLRQNHLDRLQVESLIDRRVYPISVVRAITDEGDRYNVLIHPNPSPNGHLPPLLQLYNQIIDRPEYRALLSAQFGQVDRLNHLLEDPGERGVLTDEDMYMLQAWASIRLIKDREEYLQKVNGGYRLSHEDVILRWHQEIKDNKAALDMQGISLDYNLSESFYKGIICRAIADIVDQERVLTTAS